MTHPNNKHTLRILGAAFLLQAVAFLIATIALTPLIVPDDIILTMNNITNHALKMRINILGEMIAVIGIVMLGAMLYQTLKAQNRNVALIAIGLYILTGAIIAVSRIAAFALLSVSQESVLTGHPAHLLALGNLVFELQEFGYFLHMLPYTLGAAMFYYLFHKSEYIPRALILWGLLAASLAFVGSLFDHLGMDVPIFVFVPNLPFDFAIGFWLMFKGVRVTQNDR